MSEEAFPSYQDMLNTKSINSLSPIDALNVIGTLVNNAHLHNDERGARHAITLAAELPITTWAPRLRAYAYYDLANAHDELRRHEHRQNANAWTWGPSFDQSLLYLRQAHNDEGFTQLHKRQRCQVLTNLGNTMSTIGRYVEAIEYWNGALTIDSEFSMARANRGEGYFHYAKAVYDHGHQHAFLHCAYTDLTAALPGITYYDAKTGFVALRETIAKRYAAGSLDTPHTFRTFTLGDTKAEIAYRTWACQRRLFLNPINDLTVDSVAAHDVLLTPSIVVPLAEPPFRQGFFNQLKQEYTTARWLLYQGLHHHAPRYPDRDVTLWNTLDYASYGTNLELIKLSYRSCYSLFDKVAFFLNEYLTLGIPEHQVSFTNLWYENKKKQQLRPFFENRPNLPLRGLYWLSRDLDDRAARQLQPDAAQLSTIRNHLEHKYLKAHEPDWPIAKGDPLRDDTMAYNIEHKSLEQKALRVTKLARAALLYLVLSTHIEEARRRRERGTAKIIGIPLDLYDDKWKR